VRRFKKIGRPIGIDDERAVRLAVHVRRKIRREMDDRFGFLSLHEFDTETGIGDVGLHEVKPALKARHKREVGPIVDDQWSQPPVD
jgi:hypothetical protein